MVNELDPNNPRKEYTGVWIPRDVMEDASLSALDKILFAEIACFMECYASNKWLANRIGRSASTVSKGIARLIELGYIEQCGFDGRFRRVRVVKNGQPSKKLLGSLVKNGESASPKMTNIDNSIDNSKNIDTKVSMVVEPQRTQRSLEIDQAFKDWEEIMGYPLQPNKTDRRSIHNMLQRKDMTPEKLKMLIVLVKKSQSDRYKRFSITDFTSLRYKQNDLIAWAHEKAEQNRQEQKVAEV